MTRPAVLVARRTFARVVQTLGVHFEVEHNAGDELWDRSELARRLRDKQGLLSAGGVEVDAALLAACPALRAVCHCGAGYNNIDVDACAARGIIVTHTPDVLTETTADFGFALILAAARRVAEAERHVRSGRWQQKGGIDFFAGQEVHGRTLGVLGMGRIGQAIARRAAQGFDMRVLYHNRLPLAADVEAISGAHWVDKPTLLREADHLIVTMPYTPASRHAIGAAELALMKPTATLTNIARGGVVDDAALARALQDGRLAAAALDVFEGEPALHPALLAAPSAVLTPHIASSTLSARQAMARLAADNLIAALGCGPEAGRPRNAVRAPGRPG
ncbi:MAG: 2-hydroxyacid dehydrogenase [Lautropia sp.]